MYIKIENTEDLPYGFLDFLKNRMYLGGLELLANGSRKLTKFDEYFSKIFNGSRRIKAYDIVMSGLKNIEAEITANSIHIYINRNVKVPLTRDITLYSLCMLIDQGNLELEPFPIFTKLFNMTQEQMADLILEYSYGVII